MAPANIDDVWPERREESAEDEKATPVVVSARLERPASVEAPPTVDMLVMERVSTFVILVLGCLTALFLQIDRLRREVRLLRAALPRRL